MAALEGEPPNFVSTIIFNDWPPILEHYENVSLAAIQSLEVESMPPAVIGSAVSDTPTKSDGGGGRLK